MHAPPAPRWKVAIRDLDFSQLPDGSGSAAAAPQNLFGGAGSFSGGGRGGSFDGGAEGIVVLILFALVAAVAALMGGYVVSIAPDLMAELILDAALSAGLYGRRFGIPAEQWIWIALRRAAWSAAACAFVFGVAGYVAHRVVPEACTMRQAIVLARAIQ